MAVGELIAVRRPTPCGIAFAVRQPQSSLVRSRAFTVLEALIVVAIVGILLAIGIPSFQSTIVSNRLTTTANEFVSSFNNARLTAIRRNAAVQFCSGTAANNGSELLGAACGTEAGAAFMLNAAGTATTRVAGGPALPTGVMLASSVALRFSGQGFARAAAGGTAPYSGLLLDLSTNRLSTNNRRCVYLTTGSIMSVCSASGTGACDANEPASCQ